jgi:hypothetical protein
MHVRRDPRGNISETGGRESLSLYSLEMACRPQWGTSAHIMRLADSTADALPRRQSGGMRPTTEPISGCACLRSYRCHFFFFAGGLNETPNRIETLRMRSGVHFMIRAAVSNDFEALASSITRRSSANDHDLRAIGEAFLSKDKAAGVSSLAASPGDRTRAIARRSIDSSTSR